jgi:hypothetical protein
MPQTRSRRLAGSLISPATSAADHSSSLADTAAVAGLASRHFDSAQGRGVARIASVDNLGHAIRNRDRLGRRHRLSARRTEHDRHIARLFEH